MMKKTISKCGARFTHKKEVEFIAKPEEKKEFHERQMKFAESPKAQEKKTVSSWKKKTPEIKMGDFVNLEDE